VACLNSVATLLTSLESEQEFQVFQDLVPSMLAVARTCIHEGDESTVSKVGNGGSGGGGGSNILFLA